MRTVFSLVELSEVGNGKRSPLSIGSYELGELTCRLRLYEPAFTNFF